ncbi:unnamed protein product, partial [Staurois parvus]
MEGIGTPESHDMEGIGTPESHDLEGGANTFVNRLLQLLESPLIYLYIVIISTPK